MQVEQIPELEDPLGPRQLAKLLRIRRRFHLVDKPGRLPGDAADKRLRERRRGEQRQRRKPEDEQQARPELRRHGELVGHVVNHGQASPVGRIDEQHVDIPAIRAPHLEGLAHFGERKPGVDVERRLGHWIHGKLRGQAEPCAATPMPRRARRPRAGGR
jgi:hypothetical protein